MAVIFFFSAQAHSGEITHHYFGDWNLPVRKSAHCFEYGILFLLVNRAFTLTSTLSRRACAAAAIAVTVLYSLSDEWHQSFVPGRSSSFSDCLVDTYGAVVALAWVLAYRAVNQAVRDRSNSC
jgi:VanZ family protein